MDGRGRGRTFFSSCQSLPRPTSPPYKLGAFVLGGLLASGSLRFVAPPYVDVERAGLVSRTVLARVDSRGRVGLVLVDSCVESFGGGRRSGERDRSESRLAMLRRPPW